jgi:V8-like Glu-specific endopeptidase
MSYPVYSTGFPYTAVVYLETTFADGSVSGGTGVVVGQNDILTASHVVFNASRGGGGSRGYRLSGAQWRIETFWPV